MSKKRTRRSIPAIEHCGIIIREVRPSYWMIDFRRKGRKERKCFERLDDARLYAEMLARSLKNEGLAVFDLTPEQRLDAVRALNVLAGNTSLQDAARFWRLHHDDTQSATVQEIVSLFMAAKERQGCRPTTLRELKHKTGKFADTFGGASLRSITSKAVADWMDAEGMAGTNRDNFRRAVHTLFNYGRKHGYIETIPAVLSEKVLTDAALPEAYSVAQVRKILAILEVDAPSDVWFFALQFFAGLRPHEALHIQWKEIDFEQRTIKVLPETSKVRTARIIEMNDTCAAWLAAYKAQSRPMNLTRKGRLTTGLAEKAGFPWVQDGMRHTFATAHFALHGDAHKTAAVLGHSGKLDIFYNHYRSLMTKADAEKFFAIRPAAAACNVIQMEARTA